MNLTALRRPSHPGRKTTQLTQNRRSRRALPTVGPITATGQLSALWDSGR